MITLLIVDDNVQIARVLETYGKKEGYEVLCAHNGLDAWKLFQEHSVDFVLLDIMMPEIDGITLLKMIRQISQVPVLMVTAKGEDADRIEGLDEGADDYIVKPFSAKEVMARIRAILRRLQSDSTNNDRVIKGNLSLDATAYKAWVKDVDLKLPKKEFEVLWTLVKHQGQVFTREKLLDSIWGFDYEGETRTVDSHVKRLRKKLTDAGYEEYEIITHRGLGYAFDEKE